MDASLAGTEVKSLGVEDGTADTDDAKDTVTAFMTECENGRESKQRLHVIRNLFFARFAAPRYACHSCRIWDPGLPAPWILQR